MTGRRGFLRSLGLAAGAAVLGSAPALGAGRRIAVRLDRFPRLREPGGAVALKAGDASLLIVRDSESSVRVFDSTCTHQGCTVAYDAARRQVVCPCHQSTFDLDGAVVTGPARRPLPRHEAVLDGERVVVTLP